MAIELDLNKATLLTPDIYERFACKCGACRHTCCQQWRIDISRAEYNKVRTLCDRSPNLPNSTEIFRRQPKNTRTDFTYATVKFNEQGFCPLYSEGGLCNLQLECGYSILPRICKVYPRIYNLIDGLTLTRSLDLSCESVLELLFETADTPLHFTSKSISIADCPDSVRYNISTGVFSEYTADIRNLCIWIVQNRAYSLPDRLLLLGLAMQELYKIQQENTPEQIPTWFTHYLPFTKGSDMAEALQKIKGNTELFVYNNLRFFLLEQKHRKIKPVLMRILTNIGYAYQHGVTHFDLEKYNHLCDDLESNFPDLENFFEHCIVMLMLSFSFPFNRTPNSGTTLTSVSVWEAYIHLCSLYSLMRFTATAIHLKKQEELIDSLAVLFQTSTSNYSFDNYGFDKLEKTKSDTIPQLAILLRG